MSRIRFESLLEKMFLVLSVSLFVQLMFTIGLSQQKYLGSSNGDMMDASSNVHPSSHNNNGGHVESLNTNYHHQPIGEEENRPAKNKLILSNKIIDILIKKFAENPKLQEYLKVLKKKNKYETAADEDDSFYDYQYQTKFRF